MPALSDLLNEDIDQPVVKKGSLADLTNSAEAVPPTAVAPPAGIRGGFIPAAKQAIGATVKGAGQAVADLGLTGQDNAIKRYGQEVIEANPTKVQGFGDILENPGTTVTEATGNAAGSIGTMLGMRALGQGITALSPFTGAAAPVVAGAGQLISWGGPALAAALPSFGGIRGKQIEKDPTAAGDFKDKAVAALGAATVGVIETKFGPQDWALKLTSEAGRKQLAGMLADTTVMKAIGSGAVKGGAIEGAEELVQNPVEQLASGDNPLTKESLMETGFGGVMGAVGGGVLGGAMGPAMRPRAQEVLDDTPSEDPVTDRVSGELLTTLLPEGIVLNGTKNSMANVSFPTADGQQATINIPIDEVSKLLAANKPDEIAAALEWVEQERAAKIYNKTKNLPAEDYSGVTVPPSRTAGPGYTESIINEGLYDFAEQGQAEQDMADTRKRKNDFERMKADQPSPGLGMRFAQPPVKPDVSKTPVTGYEADLVKVADTLGNEHFVQKKELAGKGKEIARYTEDGRRTVTTIPRASLVQSQPAEQLFTRLPDDPAKPNTVQYNVRGEVRTFAPAEGMSKADVEEALAARKGPGSQVAWLQKNTVEVKDGTVNTREAGAGDVNTRAAGDVGEVVADTGKSPEVPAPAADAGGLGEAAPVVPANEIKTNSVVPQQEAVGETQKEPWEKSDLATTPNIPADRVQAKKQPEGHFKLFYRGTGNEVFTGEKFTSAVEARRFFLAQQAKAQAAPKDTPSASAKAPASPPQGVPSSEEVYNNGGTGELMLLRKRSDGLVMLQDTKDNVLGTFPDAKQAATTAKEMGYSWRDETGQLPKRSAVEKPAKAKPKATAKPKPAAVKPPTLPGVKYDGKNQFTITEGKAKGASFTVKDLSPESVQAAHDKTVKGFVKPKTAPKASVVARVAARKHEMLAPAVAEVIAEDGTQEYKRVPSVEAYPALAETRRELDPKAKIDDRLFYELASMSEKDYQEVLPLDSVESEMVAKPKAVTSEKKTLGGDPDQKEAQAIQQGLEGKTALEATKFLIDNAPTASNRIIAEKVRNVLQRLTAQGIKFNFKIAHVGDQVPASLANARGLSSTWFNKTPMTVDVWLNGADVTGKSGMSYEVALHEFIHAATQAALHLGNRRSAAGTAAAKAVAGLYAVTNEIIAHFNARIEANKNDMGNLTALERAIYENRTNALANPHEILAWTLSNKEMQEYLETIKSGPETLWSRFVSSIRTLLGLPVSSNTALAKVLAASEQIFDAPVLELLTAAKTGTPATVAQTTAMNVSNESVESQMISSLNTAVKDARTTAANALASLGNPKAKGYEKWQQHAPKVFAVTPLSHLAQTYGKTIHWIKDLDKYTNELEALSNRLIDDFFAIHKEAVKVAERETGADKLTRAMLVATFNQMDPTKAVTKQDWVSDKLPPGQQIVAAQKAWVDAGMQKATGMTFTQAYAESKKEYDALGPKTQKQMVEMARYLAKLRAMDRDSALAFIEKVSKPESKLRKSLMEQFNNSFSRLRGMYFPLSRYGKFVLEYKDKDGELVREQYETSKERETAALKAKMADAQDDSIVLSMVDENPSGTGNIPSELLTKLREAISTQAMENVDVADKAALAAANAQIESSLDNFNLTVLRWLPDTSALKNSMQRKSVRGANEDMLRSVTGYVQRHASRIAWGTVGRKIEDTVAGFADENRALAKDRELAKKSPMTENPSTNDADIVDLTMRGHLLNNSRMWLQAIQKERVNAATSLIGKFMTGYFMTSPSTFLVQMTQLPTLTLPHLAAKYKSYGKAASALSTAMGQAFSKKFAKEAMRGDYEVNKVYDAIHRKVSHTDKAPGRQVGDDWYTRGELLAMVRGLKTDYQRQLLALREAEARNLLDISLVHEATDVSKGEEQGFWGKAMGYAMLPMKHGELASRKAAILASYDLATGDKNDFLTAMDETADVINKTIYNFSKRDKGWLMQKDLMRIPFTFQTYRIKTALRLGVLFVDAMKTIDTKGMTKEQIKEAQDLKTAATKEFIGIFMTTGALAGSLGVPFAGTAMGIISLLFGSDDDEPKDKKLEYTNFLTETFGKTLGDILAYGLPTVAGVNLSRRIGMGDIYGASSQPPEQLHGAGLAAWWAGNLIGPSYSIAESWVKGYDEIMNKGNYMKGLETASPKPIKDVFKAIRTATEGVKDGAGKKLLDDSQIGPDEILMIALGFAPDEITRAQNAERSLRGLNARITARRGRLIRQAAEGILDGDASGALAEIREFNSKLPLARIGGRDIKPAVRKILRGELGTTGRRSVGVATQYRVPVYLGE